MNWLINKLKSRFYAGDYKRMVEKNKIPDQLTSLKRLNHLGYKPKLIFDVGAYQGEFTEHCLSIWKDVKVHLFEALPEKVELLEEKYRTPNIKIYPGIVGEKDIEEMNFYADETASSVLFSDEVKTKKNIIKQKMLTLDSYISMNRLSAPSLLKIDTQGYEFPILQGCTRNLDQIETLLIELNFLEVYHNSKNASDVIAFLNDQGFVIYDICEIHRRPLDLALFQIDFLFVKRDSKLRKDKRWDVAK